MRTPELEFPWEWTNDYFREIRRKDSVQRKLRARAKKTRTRYVK